MVSFSFPGSLTIKKSVSGLKSVPTKIAKFTERETLIDPFTNPASNTFGGLESRIRILGCF